MGKGKGGGTQETTQSTTPWSGQQPYLTYAFEQAQGLPQQVPYAYPGVVPFAPATAAAQIGQMTRAMRGSPLTTVGQGEIGKTAAGEYLYGGPGFDRALEAAHRRIAPMVRGQFEGAGRYGSGLQQATEMQLMGDAFAGLYDQERQRQMQASALTPTMAQVDYADISALSEVGAQQENRAREALADAMSRWQFQQQAPYDRLGMQSGVIQGGSWGANQRTLTPNARSSPLGGILGGALMGYGMTRGGESAFIPGVNPFVGAAIGGGLGLFM